MKLFNIEDQNRLSEARKETEQRVLHLAEILISGRVNESSGMDIGEELMAEAHKLERIIIIEAVSDQDFNTLQKNYRSMLRPIGSLVKNLAGTDLAAKLDAARTEGVEIMNDLYEDIKGVEGGENSTAGAGIPEKKKELSQLRDKLAKNFTDVAILVKGAMALGDLFSDDPASLGGYTQMKEIISGLQTDDLLSVPLNQAFAAYQQSVSDNALTHSEKDDAKHDDWFSQGDNIDWVTDTSGGEVPAGRADATARPKHLPKKKPGFFSRLFGKRHEGMDNRPILEDEESPMTRRGGFAKPGQALTTTVEKDPFPKQEKDPFPAKSKQSPLERKFRSLLQKTMVEKSPGFARMINIPELIETLMGKSYDHLVGIFGRFNDLVSNDIDTDFLNQTINKPLTVGKALKSVWDSFTSGTMGGAGRGRPV